MLQKLHKTGLEGIGSMPSVHEVQNVVDTVNDLIRQTYAISEFYEEFETRKYMETMLIAIIGNVDSFIRRLDTETLKGPQGKLLELLKEELLYLLFKATDIDETVMN